MYKKIFLILGLIIFPTLILSSFVFAQELEITYPTVPGAQTPTDVRTPLPEYVRYIFNFSIWIAGFVAFGALFYGGVRYLTSAGSPTAAADARNQIFAGILGLIIIISAYTILININPQLVILRVELQGTPAAGEIPGVYLCKTPEFSASTCIVYTITSYTIDPNFDDEVQYVFFKNTDTAVYGAVLHQDKGLQGDCQVLTGDGAIDIKASSMTVFRQRSGNGGVGITVYDDKNYNEGSKNNKYYDFGTSKTDQDFVDLSKYKFINCSGQFLCDLDGSISSIKVNNNYMAILYDGKNFTSHCEVFQGPLKADWLKTYNIGNDQASSLKVISTQ